jgi:oligopeptide transport system substrate-binding protein
VHQLFWNAWIGDYPDAQTFLDLYRDGSAQNHGKYFSVAYERLLAEGVATGDNAQRQQLWRDAEVQLNADAAYIPVYYYQSRHLLRPWVQGWQSNLMDRHASRDLSITAGPPR